MAGGKVPMARCALWQTACCWVGASEQVRSQPGRKRVDFLLDEKALAARHLLGNGFGEVETLTA